MGKQGQHKDLLEVANLEKGDFDHSDLSHLERKRLRSSHQPPDFSLPDRHNNTVRQDHNLLSFIMLQLLYQVFYDMPERRYSLCIFYCSSEHDNSTTGVTRRRKVRGLNETARLPNGGTG